jgi:hypothetical protein
VHPAAEANGTYFPNPLPSHLNFRHPPRASSGGAGSFPLVQVDATVCLDGATGSACSTVNTTDVTSSTPIVLFSLTGLSNTVHTITVTNIPDPSQGGALGFLTVDRFSLDTTTTAPFFATGSTIATVPVEFSYHVPLTLGGHTPALEGSLPLFLIYVKPRCNCCA